MAEVFPFPFEEYVAYKLAHEDRMKPVFAQFAYPRNLNQAVSDYVASDWVSPKEADFVLFLRECYTHQELTEFKAKLKGCRCCSRHSHYRDVRYKPTTAVPESKKSISCFCHCRHYLRLFDRTHLA